MAGSDLRPGTPAFEAALARSASAFLAARPDDCALEAWLAGACGARSLRDPSTAMQPSIAVGDTFLTVPVDDARPIRRGDVLAFHGPLASDPATIYVSRVVGLPGDRIALRGGTITVDGTALPRVPSGRPVTVEDGSPALPRFVETSPDGRRYDVLGRAPDPAGRSPPPEIETLPEITVPAGRFFMMGDDRPRALDSRYAARGEGPGLPARADIVGRVTLIYASRDPSRIGRRP